MAHMVDRMVYAGAEPWHGLGRHLPAECDSDTLRDLVFDWAAVERPVFTTEGEWGLTGRPLPDYKALVRSDNGYLLSVVPASYGVVQYGAALALLDAAVKDGEARYITAGTLKKGRRAWALATVPSATFDVAGAELKPYLLLSTAHDLSRCVRVLFTATYVVCNNTESAALLAAGVTPGKKAHISNVLQIRHTSTAQAQVDRAALLIQEARSYFGAFHEAALQLVNSRFTEGQFAEMAKRLFPDDEKGQAPKARGKVIELFQGAQRAAAHAPGTKWAAFNAVTELVDHHVNRRTPETRFEGVFFGSGSVVRQQAMDLLLAA